MKNVWINNKTYLISDYTGNNDLIASLPETEKNIISFICEWLEGRTEFRINTSGSTGKPKEMALSRNQLQASARMTLEYLDIQPDQNLLLCLDTKYIAGLMQIVRAIVGHCNLFAITPTSHPLADFSNETKIHLCSMVSIQVANSLQSMEQKLKFQSIENILIGGGPINISLEKELEGLTNAVYHTFGMTETISHIALKKINENNSHFLVLKEIKIKTDSRGCLMIKGNITNQKWITTNDLVILNGNDSFDWIGRYDNVISSAGKKTIAESLERKITILLEGHGIELDFIIAGKKDKMLGEKIVMVFETKNSDKINQIQNLLNKQLDKHEKPREYLISDQLYSKDRRKVNRQYILTKAKKII